MNDIHKSAIIGPGVSMGVRNTIGPNVVLIGPLKIGDDNWFGPGVTIGTPPEVRSAPHGDGWNTESISSPTLIGSRNIIREGVSIQKANYRQTTIGDDCFIMSRAYIAHDCLISDGVTISANVSLAGHCHIQSRATLGLASTCHQFTVIGTGAMIGMSSAVTKNVPPYAMIYGVPGSIRGANLRGMEAHGFDSSLTTQWHVALLSDGNEAAIEDLKLTELKSTWIQAIQNVHLKDSERI